MHPVLLRAGSVRHLAAALALVVWGAASAESAAAQLPKPSPDLSIRLPELEVYQIRPQSNPVPAGSEVVIAIGARNNGTASAAFDYALGPKNRSAVWVIGNGATLSPGKTHIGGIRMTYSQAYNYFRSTLGANNPGGMQTVCFGVFLLRDGSKDLFLDGNNPNHQKEQCLKFEFPIP